MAWVAPVLGLVASAYQAYQSGQNNDKVAAAGQEKLRNLREATAILEQQRQRRFQGGMNALANQTGAYQGAMNMLASMYGPRGSVAPNLSLDRGAPRMSGSPPPSTAPVGNGLADIARMFGQPGGPGSGSQPPPVGRQPPPLNIPPQQTTPATGGPGMAQIGAGQPPPQKPIPVPSPSTPTLIDIPPVLGPIGAQRAGTPLGGMGLPADFGLGAVGKVFSGGGTPINPGGGGTPIIFNPGGDLV